MVNFQNKPTGTSWLVWEVPKLAITIGRALICIPRASKMKIAEGALDNDDVRFHYALPDGQGGWKVTEDSHKSSPVKYLNQDCTPMVVKLEAADIISAREGGMWFAVEWEEESIFEVDYLVAM